MIQPLRGVLPSLPKIELSFALSSSSPKGGCMLLVNLHAPDGPVGDVRCIGVKTTGNFAADAALHFGREIEAQTHRIAPAKPHRQHIRSASKN